MILAAIVLLLPAGPTAAQQTVTFTNASPPVVITLQSGANISVTPNGSLSTQCVLSGTGCQGAGAGGSAPTASLSASGFSNAPNAQGQYPVGTTFSLATSSNAEACRRFLGSGSPAVAAWSGGVGAPFGPASITLSTAGTYSFQVECYGDGGSRAATLPNVVVAGGGGGTPGSCAGVSPPPGWVRSNTVRPSQVVRVEGGGFWQQFPISGGFGYLITSSDEFHAIELTTPAAAWSGINMLFDWGEAQQGGAANLNRVYVTISTCPGDFRIPVRGSTAPANDPTFARGCTNIRDRAGFPSQVNANIRYEVSTQPSTESVCRIAPGGIYYLNFIRADARDGFIDGPALEASCNFTLTQCGVQLRYD